MSAEPSDTHWNYRIVKTPDGLYDLREVYYEGDEVTGYTAHSIDFGPTEDPQEIIDGLKRALKDAKTRGILEVDD